MNKQTYRRRNYDPAPRNLSGIQYFYMSLVGWGIIVTEQGGHIVISGPLGNVSPVLEQRIRDREAALLAHLKTLPKDS